MNDKVDSRFIVNDDFQFSLLKSLFGAGLNCKSVVYGSGEENNSDFIGINERLFSKSGSENIGLQE
ncbi:MAG: hypothetical protein AAGI49_18890, partial [Bacteroidota bacterium]